jgi:hypothetical protein
MPLIELPYDAENYEDFLNEDLSLLAFLETTLNDGGNPMEEYDEGSKGEVLSQLLSYHSDEGGSPVCYEFSLTDEELDMKSLSGKVNLNYNVEYFFSCDDMNKDDDHYETVSFHINQEEQVLILDFLDTEKRTTRDEF